MELAKAYPAEARLKSWRRTVRLDRGRDVVEISDSYSLMEPVPEIILNLMTACEVKESGKGQLTLTSAQGAPSSVIAFDLALLSASVETIPLENAELRRNWGNQIYRIQLKTPGAKTSGRLKLTITAV